MKYIYNTITQSKTRIFILCSGNILDFLSDTDSSFLTTHTHMSVSWH